MKFLCKSAKNGFTLIELMVTVAMIGIVMMIAAPSFGDFILRQQVSSKKDVVVNAFRLAKSQALSLASNVSVQWVPLAAAAVNIDGNGDGTNDFVIQPGEIAVFDTNPTADNEDVHIKTFVLTRADEQVNVSTGNAGPIVFNALGGLATTLSGDLEVVICKSAADVNDNYRATLNRISGQLNIEYEVGTCAATVVN